MDRESAQEIVRQEIVESFGVDPIFEEEANRADVVAVRWEIELNREAAQNLRLPESDDGIMLRGVTLVNEDGNVERYINWFEALTQLGYAMSTRRVANSQVVGDQITNSNAGFSGPTFNQESEG